MRKSKWYLGRMKFIHVIAQLKLYFMKKSSSREEIMRCIEKAGDNPNQFQIDMMIMSGLIIYKKNPESARFYFEEAVKYKPEAAYHLAVYYNDKNDTVNKVKWLKYGAENGESMSQYNLGQHYSKNGNNAEAIKWHLKAAEQGHIAAKNKLAVLYHEEGEIEKAEYWYLKAVRYNYGAAQFNLGVLYEEQNRIVEAERWYLEAVRNLSVEAKGNLGYLYYKLEEIELAKEWLFRAAASGDEGVVKLLNAIVEDEKHYF